MSRTPDSPPRTLNDIPPGQRVRIRGHRSSGAVRQRLLDLGLMPNTVVTMVRSAPLNDPIEIKLAAGSITLRRQEAATVEVEDPNERDDRRQDGIEGGRSGNPASEESRP
ncbi:MAG: ferrous iron transport protein A [Thiocapsa sp.]|uniref:FeoA family protein n=1 Tax=Thiocapsa sp. TaxID=2024551 RepID=UPI001BCFF151|nr:FeoA family protein [Thiocapsa sp.]QVL48202.1 MAG: ferrous iron transport protein A [Thiocapsa sp.]